MATELSDSFTLLLADGLYRAQAVFPQPIDASDELSNKLEQLLQRIQVTSGSLQLVVLAQQTLIQLHHIRAADPLTNITDFIARAFRLRPDDLQSRARNQRLAFIRHVAMYLCRENCGASFPRIGQHFGRNHSTVIYACRFIERRMARDTAFHILIQRLSFQIAGTAPVHGEVSA